MRIEVTSGSGELSVLLLYVSSAFLSTFIRKQCPSQMGCSICRSPLAVHWDPQMVLGLLATCDSEESRQSFDPARELPKLLGPLTSIAYTHSVDTEGGGAQYYQAAGHVTASYAAVLTMMRSW